MKYQHLPPTTHMKDAGLQVGNSTYITHTTLSHHHSAVKTITFMQKVVLISLVALLFLGLIFNALGTVIVVMAIITTIYFIDVLFSTYVLFKSLHESTDIVVPDVILAKLDDNKLPVYTILCPLYKESRILPHFVESISKFDWPKNKLEVLLLLEEDDAETINAAYGMNLPDYFKVVVVPHSLPKTKPKACNYGLSIATGEYVVIYDAEDIPDIKQLKKVYATFQALPQSYGCIQCKLNYFNPHHNLLTRLFTAEYSLWFDVILPGLQSIEGIIPLGGTSNHFRRSDLLSFEAWDPFNVTEDCDLGVRLFKAGKKTAIVDSVTLEEANSNVKNWIRQRSRWIKGYFQTYLVHMRNPIALFAKHREHALIMQLVIGMRMTFMLINPLLWLMTISYFLFNQYVGAAIESFFPTFIFYMASFALVVGNFVYIYNYMIGCAARKHWDLIKFVFFIPFYWLIMSIAAVMALWQLITKPHYWEKTNHGLHLIPKKT
jgi:glycosyltransferase XagB